MCDFHDAVRIAHAAVIPEFARLKTPADIAARALIHLAWQVASNYIGMAEASQILIDCAGEAMTSTAAEMRPGLHLAMLSDASH